MGTKARIRWSLVVIALTCGFVAWFLSGVETAFTWDEILEALRIHNKTRYTRTAVLGVLTITIVALLRLLRRVD